ncbi:MAG: hypothetical protein AB1717_10915 [Pseudomonadota bacterium]
MNQILARHIEDHTEERLEQIRRSLHSSSAMLARAADTLLESIMQGQRVLLLARRETLFTAQIASGLLQRGMLQTRPALPALLCAPLPDDSSHYPAHVSSLANPGDVLWVFAQYDHEELSALIDSAHELGLKLILLATPLPQTLNRQLEESDVLIQLAAPTQASLNECALSAVHAICDALDHRLLGMI